MYERLRGETFLNYVRSLKFSTIKTVMYMCCSQSSYSNNSDINF